MPAKQAAGCLYWIEVLHKWISVNNQLLLGSFYWIERHIDRIWPTNRLFRHGLMTMVDCFVRTINGGANRLGEWSDSRKVA